LPCGMCSIFHRGESHLTGAERVHEHIAPSVRTCRGSIRSTLRLSTGYRTRNDGRHKCRPYKDLKRKFLYYQGTKNLVRFAPQLVN